MSRSTESAALVTCCAAIEDEGGRSGAAAEILVYVRRGHRPLHSQPQACPRLTEMEERHSACMVTFVVRRVPASPPQYAHRARPRASRRLRGAGHPFTPLPPRRSRSRIPTRKPSRPMPRRHPSPSADRRKGSRDRGRFRRGRGRNCTPHASERRFRSKPVRAPRNCRVAVTRNRDRGKSSRPTTPRVA